VGQSGNPGGNQPLANANGLQTHPSRAPGLAEGLNPIRPALPVRQPLEQSVPGASRPVGRTVSAPGMQPGAAVEPTPIPPPSTLGAESPNVALPTAPPPPQQTPRKPSLGMDVDRTPPQPRKPPSFDRSAKPAEAQTGRQAQACLPQGLRCSRVGKRGRGAGKGEDRDWCGAWVGAEGHRMYLLLAGRTQPFGALVWTACSWSTAPARLLQVLAMRFAKASHPWHSPAGLPPVADGCASLFAPRPAQLGQHLLYEQHSAVLAVHIAPHPLFFSGTVPFPLLPIPNLRAMRAVLAVPKNLPPPFHPSPPPHTSAVPVYLLAHEGGGLLALPCTVGRAAFATTSTERTPWAARASWLKNLLSFWSR
jgi:hypothetical protein